MTDVKLESPDEKTWCCKAHQTVVLGVAKVLTVAEGGAPLSELADLHDFGYTSQTEPKLPVALKLDFRFCPWCGTRRDATHKSRTVETIHSMPTVIVRPVSARGEEKR